MGNFNFLKYLLCIWPFNLFLALNSLWPGDTKDIVDHGHYIIGLVNGLLPIQCQAYLTITHADILSAWALGTNLGEIWIEYL